MAFIKSAFRVSRARGGATLSAGPVDLTFFFLAPEMNTSIQPKCCTLASGFHMPFVFDNRSIYREKTDVILQR